MMRVFNWVQFTVMMISVMLVACATQASIQQSTQKSIAEQAAVSVDGSIYRVAVKAGVSYQDVLDSLKSLSAGMNLVNPANFPISEHMKKRGLKPQGQMAVHTYCNLSAGTEIFLDHPEFLVYAPCRVAIYEQQGQLYLALSRPTHDLKHIKNPTSRAIKAAEQLEASLIELLDRASEGDF